MMKPANKRIMVFSGRSNPVLGNEIVEELSIDAGKVKISQFTDGEIYVKFLESVRGADVFLIQTFSDPVNKNIMELLIMADALKRASAKRVSAVIPYYGYSRQDKKTTSREPITAKLVADLLQNTGIDRVVTMDLHAGQIQGFFDIPVDHLTALKILVSHFSKMKLQDLVVVSPDVGRVKLAKKFSDQLGSELAILHKTRPDHNLVEVGQVVGEVKGKVALLVDDMIDTAGTITEGAKTLIKKGATEVYTCATHGVLSGQALERIEASAIKELVLTNTIPLEPKKKLDKITILSIAPLFAQAINNIYEDESVSTLFGDDGF